jgi:hypothetical protein
MPKKAASSTDMMTTIARGVGTAVGRIANTAQRVATASSEAVKAGSSYGKKTKRSKPSATKKKAVKKAGGRKPKAKAKKKTSRART